MSFSSENRANFFLIVLLYLINCEANTSLHHGQEAYFRRAVLHEARQNCVISSQVENELKRNLKQDITQFYKAVPDDTVYQPSPELVDCGKKLLCSQFSRSLPTTFKGKLNALLAECEGSVTSSSTVEYTPVLVETGGERIENEENFSDYEGEYGKIAAFSHIHIFVFIAGFGLGVFLMHYISLVKGTNLSEPKKVMRRPEL